MTLPVCKQYLPCKTAFDKKISHFLVFPGFSDLIKGCAVSGSFEDINNIIKMNIDFETMAVLEEESHNESIGVFGSAGSASADGGERREGGKRGRRPGRKATLDKSDMKAKLERSRQSARECRARKKLRYQYLEELVADRERSVLTLRKELEKLYKLHTELEQGRTPEDLELLLQEHIKQE